MRGMLATAEDPSAAGTTGTSRQPAGSSPSARQAFSTRTRVPGSRAKTIAKPAPGAPVSAAVSGMRMPAPSPVTPSAAQAPRCETAARPASARSSSSRDARPFASTTRPMPHASRSRTRSASRFGVRERVVTGPATSVEGENDNGEAVSRAVCVLVRRGGRTKPASEYAAARTGRKSPEQLYRSWPRGTSGFAE